MIQGVPSFKGFHVTQKGKDSLSDKPVDFIQEDLLPAAKMAKEDDKNCLSVEDDGNVYIETPVYGKFTAYNFPNPKVRDRYFSCEVITPEGNVKTISVPFENAEAAKQFMTNKCKSASYTPRLTLDLYKAIVAADHYKQSLLNQIDALSE